MTLTETAGEFKIKSSHGVDVVNAAFKTEGYVVNEKGGKLELQPVTLPPMTATMVQVKIQMVSLCHTDVHMRDNDMGISDYPMLLGHEGVGVVTHLGSAVRTLKIGDTVGIGWIRDSCTGCRRCKEGRENLCENGYQAIYLSSSAGPIGKSPLQYNLHGGCFARYQRIEERFAVKIPDGVPPEMASPLLCGGATVFEPLCDYVTAGAHVGVLGIGGLGTAAVKLARLRGCIVWAISGTPSKREGILQAGAHHFVNLGDKEARRKATGKLDLIIDTSPINPAVDQLLELLALNGTLCKVGVPLSTDCTYSGDWRNLIFCQRKLVGSGSCGTKRLDDMMELVAANMDFMKDIDGWKTEHLPMSKVNEAMDLLQNRKNAAYRYVLEWK
ncbi:putative formaldehyde dehydrogenase AdhA [Gracilariopsis chorda]|uniref:Putative formaldehyde dehydrogenase AdhA n=1 Tax=Gracilariopsis chorda TaxID=448386 RepID=A0A2V3IV76_9FLOR|nr:putative formaldehyde dehydrogenase AdhA [Gracilariopsis chorda]|eukprot:PXF46046.1 putative formaldehyde dehydrogenase AdhA [Gracilariopsis chorda]